MKKRLYDFSAGMAVCAVFSFVILTVLFAYHGFKEGSVFCQILFFLVLLAFCFLLYRFVFTAAVLEEEGIRKGKLFIRKKDLRIAPLYDIRFRESVYRIRDASAHYLGLSEKEQGKRQIRVEATSSNQKRLEAYLGGSLEPAPKPKYSARKRRR